MVNAAFPPNETSARAMETALGLLRGMADRGNIYLGSRHSLLLELKAAIGSRPANAYDNVPVSPAGLKLPATPATENGANLPEISDGDVQSSNSQGLPNEWPQQPDLPSFRDIAFQFDLNDDPALWEGALDQIDMNMDTDWIENTLKR
jgi:proline utilization trans-activator